MPVSVRALRVFSFVAALFSAAGASAACIHDGVATYTCSGDVSGSTVIGTTGADSFVFQAGATGSNVTIISGGGADTLDFSDDAGGLSIDLTQGSAQTVRAGLSIHFQGFASAPGTTVRGGQGVDTIVGGSGDDVFLGGPGGDVLTGGTGSDTRSSEAAANCAADVLSSIEIDLCVSPPVANPSNATVPYGAAATAIALDISGGSPDSVAVASPPAHGTAIVSGTDITYEPAAGYAGADSFTYTATNTAGTSAPATVSITVGNPVFTVVASDPLSATAGVAYSQTFTWSGGAAPFSNYQVSGLPTGLSIVGSTANSVTVAGTPTAAGTFPLNASADDSSSGDGPFTAAQEFALAVAGPTLVLLPAPGTLALDYNVAVNESFVASGGNAPYGYVVTSGTLPPGLDLDASGQLTGTPTTPGSYVVVVTATDGTTGTGAPFTVSGNYVLEVGAAALNIAPVSLSPGVSGTPYAATLVASGGAEPYTFAIDAGALPAGLALSASGGVNGTPTAAGDFDVTVRVTDDNGQTAARAYTLIIAPPTLTLAPATLPGGTGGEAYSQSFTASGGVSPYSYALASGVLPAGVTLAANGALSGTPTQSGTFAFSVTATDGTAGTAGSVTNAYTLSIEAQAQVLVFPAQAVGTRSFVPGTTFAVNPLATGGDSGNPIVYTAGPANVCTISGTTVTMVGAGTCLITASQSGGGGFGAAEPVVQSVVLQGQIVLPPSATRVPALSSYTLALLALMFAIGGALLRRR